MRRGIALTFGIADGAVAALALFGVFVALPARWWPVDAATAVLAGLFGAASFGLVRGARWGERVARAASLASLAVGLGLIATLAFTASYLSGIYGPVGEGGAIILALVGALVVPYLIVFPTVQLVWLGPATTIETSAIEEKGP